MACHTKEVRSIYDIDHAEVAAVFVNGFGHDLQDNSCPTEVRAPGRTIPRWRDQITAWHQAKLTNTPTEAANSLMKRIKRIGFGFTRVRNCCASVLLDAGRPKWALLATITPR